MSFVGGPIWAPCWFRIRADRSGTLCAGTQRKMDSWDTDSCDWGDSSEEASSSEEDELDVKYNKE